VAAITAATAAAAAAVLLHLVQVMVAHLPQFLLSGVRPPCKESGPSRTSAFAQDVNVVAPYDAQQKTQGVTRVLKVIKVSELIEAAVHFLGLMEFVRSSICATIPFLMQALNWSERVQYAHSAL
jgi:hypothetical protein